MYNIEKYTEGRLDQISLILFERKMRKDKKFKKRVILYKSIDNIMQGVVMATAAEFEMIEKKIDLVAADFVSDFKRKKEKPEKIMEFLSWS